MPWRHRAATSVTFLHSLAAKRVQLKELSKDLRLQREQPGLLHSLHDARQGGWDVTSEAAIGLQIKGAKDRRAELWVEL